MSHFSESLKGLMGLHEPALTGLALAAKAQISSSTLSRILSDQQVATAEHVGLLCAVISIERERRVELLLSYLRDVVAAAAIAGLDERHVVLASADESRAGAGSLGADLELLAEECAKHDDIRALVADLARMSMRHRAELVDAQVYPFPVGGAVGAVAETPASSAGPAASAGLQELKRRAARADAPRADKASPAPRK